MRKQLTFIATLAVIGAAAFAQQDPSKSNDNPQNQSSGNDSQSENQPGSAIIIVEPSGAQPADTPGYQPVPTDAAAGGTATGTEITSTITISRTITNLPNTITIIGTVDSDQQKQQAESKLQEALQGKTIRNLLVVSNANTSISEPSGAERRFPSGSFPSSSTNHVEQDNVPDDSNNPQDK